MISKPALAVAISLRRVFGDHPEESSVEVPDIVLILKRLRDLGTNLGDFSVHRSGNRYYSDTVTRILGNYLRFGYASQRSPLRLTPSGMVTVNSIVSEAESEDCVEVRHMEEQIDRIVNEEARV
jgi:hypothetical protein